MKKILCIVLAAALIGCLALPVAAEGIDLSALSWDELIALKAEINKELTTRDEWQEVVVPQGVWVVGEDIPEGKWTVRCPAGPCTKIAWSYELADNGHSIKITLNCDSALIYNKKDADDGDMTQYTFDAKSGMYVCIDFSSAEFTPYTGKQSLGFK
mgnify:CR=1 FL=1